MITYRQRDGEWKSSDPRQGLGSPRRVGRGKGTRSWKLPLPVFIEELYRKRFGRARPEYVLSIEEHARRQEKKRAAKREAKLQRRQGAAAELEGTVRTVDPDMSSERGSERIEQPAVAAGRGAVRLPEAEEGRPSPHDPGADSADADG
jgi:hypothetical protein